MHLKIRGIWDCVLGFTVHSVFSAEKWRIALFLSQCKFISVCQLHYSHPVETNPKFRHNWLNLFYGTPFSKVLKEDTDYIKNGDTYIILKEFLKTLREENENVLVFKMDGGDHPVFTIHIAPDEGGFDIDWTLRSLSPWDGIRTEEIANKISLISETGLEELIEYYQEILEFTWTAEITPQYEADWWYAIRQGNFIYAIYLTAGEEFTNIIITFYLPEDQPI
jgi:hypothetical protein